MFLIPKKIVFLSAVSICWWGSPPAIGAIRSLRQPRK